MTRSMPRIGRGKNMSIAKAALIYFYETLILEWKDGFLEYGNLNAMHDIVDIAGAKHCSFMTHFQVTACLANSPYWDKEFIPGFYRGMRGHGGANTFKPSKKGEVYYNKYLKRTEEK